MPSPLELISTARRLVNSIGGERASDADIRRAVSTAYYAMFHVVAASAADFVVGAVAGRQVSGPWLHVYRAVDHAQIKRACIHGDLRRTYSPDIIVFATVFEQMQSKRHKADYDPSAVFQVSAVLLDINGAESAIERFQHAAESDRRSFLAFALFRNR